jgi:hypothetical protein
VASLCEGSAYRYIGVGMNIQSDKMLPMTLPWNKLPTHTGERECWQAAHDDILDACVEESITALEARWFLDMLCEMFSTPDLRTPQAIWAARLCFLYTDVGDA